MIHRLFHLAVVLCVALPMQAIHAQSQPYDYATWRQFWSFKPVVKPQPPEVKDQRWVRNPIDAFILARLEGQGMKPAPEADKHTLIRRATFDLTGLPPTLSEIDAFIKDTSPDAYENLIKRLLASPHYGERYGRHWLDVVRYEQDKVKLPGVKNTRGALDFRDYIIRSFNSDKPYNQLIAEHLAGDLLPVPDEREKYFDQLTATAFLSIGNWFDQCTDPNRLKLDIIDEQINAMSKAFMGLTISCARCHDHKFDPITEKDYYALAGIFASTRIMDVFNEDWKDGRVRLTREKVMPDQANAKRLLAEEVIELRQKAWRIKQEAFKHFLKKVETRSEELAVISVTLPKVEVRLFEAEQFTGQSNLRIVTVRNSDGEDVDVIEAQTPGDQWVKYELKVPAEGSYVLEVLHAGDDDKRVAVQVGGMTVVDSVSLPDTLGIGHEHRRWSTLGDFKLREGINTIRIAPADKDESFPRFDRFRWYRLPDGFDTTIRDEAAKREFRAEVLREIAIGSSLHDFTAASLPVEAIEQATRERITKAMSRAAELRLELAGGERIIAVTDHHKPIDLPVHIGGDTYRVSKTVVSRNACAF